jgi:hypothetical protein
MSSSDLLHGAEVREGYLVSGDATVIAFARHENNSRNNFILFDVEEKKICCDKSAAKWLPGAVTNHLGKLSKTIADKSAMVAAPSTRLEASPASSAKKSKYSGRQKKG